jgi:hypothetical protein
MRCLKGVVPQPRSIALIRAPVPLPGRSKLERRRNSWYLNPGLFATVLKIARANPDRVEKCGASSRSKLRKPSLCTAFI